MKKKMKKIVLVLTTFMMLSQISKSQSFTDNFSDGNYLGWFDLMYSGYDSWNVENEKLNVSYNLSDETAAILVSPAGAVSDFTFEISVGKEDANDWCNEIGIGRYSDIPNTYIFWRVDVEEGILELGYNDGAGNVDLFTETLTQNMVVGELIPLKLSISGTAPTLTVTAWWDGEQKWTGNISGASEALAQGHLAIVVSNHPDEAVSAWIDDISITYQEYINSTPNLSENFSDGNYLGWFDLMYSGYNSWNVENEKLHVSYSLSDETAAVLVSPAGAVSDFTFEISVGKEDANDWCNEIGVGRYSDIPNTYIYWRVDAEEGILELGYNDGGGSVDLFTETLTENLVVGELVPLKLSVSGTAPILTVTAWWDGEQKWSGNISGASEALAQGHLAIVVSNHPDVAVSAWIDDITITKENTTAINYYDKHEIISIYPNPVLNILNINTQDISKDNVFVNVYDLQGKNVMCENIHSNTIQMNVNTFKKGTYIIKLTDERGNLIKTEKIIKQ